MGAASRPPGPKKAPGHRAGGDRRGPRFNQRVRERQQVSTPILVDRPLSDGFRVGDEVVNAYLGLLADKCRFSQIRTGVGATNSGFWELLKNPHFGWEGGSQRHLNRDHKVNLIPAFFGLGSAGHWAAVIVDSTLSHGSRKFLYIDSVRSMRQGNFRRVKELFRGWENDDANFVLMDSPEEAEGSNDCAVFTLAACAYYVLRAGNFIPSSFEFNTPIENAQFGRGWRRHVHKSIVNESIDLNDNVFGWMVLKNQL